jgi:hypothetical protein
MVKSAALLGIVALASLASSAVAARSLEALQSPDPAHETAAPADVGFAASCRAAARELLGQGSFTFERPSYGIRGGEAVVRMDVGVPGLASDGIFRAVCVRDRQSGAVEAAIFDAPADGHGPRVISLAAPEGAGPAGSDSGRSTIVFNYSGPGAGAAYGGLYGGFWPGFGRFDGPAFHRHRSRDRAVIDLRANPNLQPRFIAPRHHSKGFKRSFGSGVRLGTGGFIR